MVILLQVEVCHRLVPADDDDVVSSVHVTSAFTKTLVKKFVSLTYLQLDCH